MPEVCPAEARRGVCGELTGEGEAGWTQNGHALAGGRHSGSETLGGRFERLLQEASWRMLSAVSAKGQALVWGRQREEVHWVGTAEQRCSWN